MSSSRHWLWYCQWCTLEWLDIYEMIIHRELITKSRPVMFKGFYTCRTIWDWVKIRTDKGLFSLNLLTLKKNRFRNPTFKNIKWQSHWKHFEITFKLKFLKYFKFEEFYAIFFFMKHGAIRRTLHKRVVKVVWYHCLIWIKHLIRIFIHVNFCCSGRKIYRCLV